MFRLSSNLIAYHFAYLSTQACWLLLLVAVIVAPQSLVHAQNSVGFDKVIELLQLEVKEEKLIALIESQPEVYVLSEQQIDQLRRAGGTDKLIAKMTTKAKDAVQSDTLAYVLIIDVSGSMTETLSEGQSKWDVAKKSAIELVNKIPAGLQVGVVVYGHKAEQACAVELLRPLSPIANSDKESLIAKIRSLVPAGKTPITKSLQFAGEQVAEVNGSSRVILITDGIETCGGDPVQEASALTGRMKNATVDVIGFALPADETANVSKIALAGRGRYTNATTVTEFQQAIERVSDDMLQKLTTTVGEVKLIASKDQANPTAIAVGNYTKARLGAGNYHYWTVDFPAGEFDIVYDVSTSHEGLLSQVIGSASVGTIVEGEFRAEQTAGVSENEIRVRGIAKLKLSAPATKIIQVHNGPYMSSIEDYYLGVFRSDDKYGKPFLVDCPEINELKIDQEVTSPLLGGAKKFYLDCDAYYHVQLPAGDHELSVTWSSSEEDKFGSIRQITTFDTNGVKLEHLAGGERNQTKKVVLQTADPQEFLIRVRAASEREKVTISVKPQ